MDIRLDGQVALVTGGSKGIGKSIARGLVESGASVMLVSRKQENLDAARAEFPQDRVATFTANVGDATAAAAAVRATMDAFGRLDILVNNAATNPYAGRVSQIGQAQADKTVQVNQYAPLFWSRAAWEAWMGDHGGAIINIATIGAFVVSPGIGYYDATKAAMLSLSRHMAWEFAPNVRVNAIAPGAVRTDMNRAMWDGHEDELTAITLAGRLGEPEDISPMAIFLVSDAARWITGATFVVDGGTLAVPLGGTHMEA